MFSRIKNHDLLVSFREMRPNQKWCIWTEPLWNIPHQLFLPFTSLFMSKVGLTPSQIGNTISLCFFLQIISALFGGVLTDKMGRRMATWVSDCISWVIPCMIWAFARDYWWFMLAAAFNSVQQMAYTAWYCLFIEDCPPKHVTNAFTLTQMCGMLAVFFSPLAVWLVGKFGVVSALSGIYIVAGVCMFIKNTILIIFCKETDVGIARMAETKGVSSFKLLYGYKDIFLRIVKSSRMRLVALLMILSNIYLIANENFFSLYITEKLLLPDRLVAAFPMIRMGIMLLFVIGLQKVFNKIGMKKSFLFALAAYVVSHIILLIPTVKFGVLTAGFYTLLEASAYAIIMPRRKSLMAFFADAHERSRIFALYTTIMVAVSFPFGRIVGELYAMSPTYPFLFNLILFALTIILVATSKDLTTVEKEMNEQS